MRKRIIVSALSMSWLALTTVLFLSLEKMEQAQTAGQQNQSQPDAGRGRGGVRGGAETTAASVPPPPGWKPCPRCQNNTDRRAANEKHKVEGHSFDPHDFSGVWGLNGTGELGTRARGAGV